MYDTVMLAAHRNIFGERDDDTRFKIVLQRLQGGEDLGETVGQIAGVTLANIMNTAAKQKREIPRQTIVEAADETVDRLLDIAEAAKLVKGDREAVKKKAMFGAVKVIGQAELPRLTPEGKAKVQAEMDSLRKPKQSKPKSGVIGARMGVA